MRLSFWSFILSLCARKRSQSIFPDWFLSTQKRNFAFLHAQKKVALSDLLQEAADARPVGAKLAREGYGSGLKMFTDCTEFFAGKPRSNTSGGQRYGNDQ